MTIVLGCDPGLASLGWCLLDSRDARIRRAGYVATSKRDETGDMQRRVTDLLSEMRTAVDRLPVALAVIEWPSAGGFGRPGAGQTAGNAKSAAQTTAAAAAMLGMLTALRIETLTPAPITWRTALGCERGKDGELHARLAGIYPRTIGRLRKGVRPHVLDAIGLALYGRLVATTRIRRVA